MLKRIIPYAHHLLESTISPGDMVIDATCGNGNDTAFLSELVGLDGHVYAFDIQAEAITASQDKTRALGLGNITYIHDSHAHVDTHLPSEIHGTVAGAIFNLGYLPRSDKQIITKADSTLPAIEKMIALLKKNGIIVIVIYHGHDGGKEEKDAVLTFAEQLNRKAFAVIKYQFINQENNPPFVVAIQKNK